MFGLEYTLHPHLAAIAYDGMSPCEDFDAASARVLQFERRIFVALA